MVANAEIRLLLMWKNKGEKKRRCDKERIAVKIQACIIPRVYLDCEVMLQFTLD